MSAAGRPGRAAPTGPRLRPAPEHPDAQAPPVVDADGLVALLERVGAAGRYGFDTEFHREKTYWPQLALLQFSWREGPDTRAALVDPLAVPVGRLTGLLGGPATLVAHAADQDLEILQHECGTGPGRLFDTQIAAGFAGHGSASLATLTRVYLGYDLPKGDRLTDWSARPLQESQRRYAIADVAHLLDLEEAIREDLDRRGRLAWAEQECELLRLRAARPAEPDRAWWRLRDARQLRGPSRGVAQALAAWREARARRIDVPLRYVLPDLAIQALAHKPPTERAQLASVRGLDARFLRGDAGDEIFAAVQEGRRLPAGAIQDPPGDEVPRELRPAVALAMAWLGQLARQEDLDLVVLATRGDVVDLLADRGGRLAEGWRADLVGEPLRRLVGGTAAVAFDGAGGLALEERSYQPLKPGASAAGGGPPPGAAG